jgi:2-hydroxycyclohexanecarboxyl-CoA dehydrogenase
MKLQGKTALIAGGGGGIGRAVALALAYEGAKTAVADIVKDNAEKVSGEVKALGVDAMACPVDLTKKAEVDRMVSEILARFGQIDILVNCQGWDRLEPFVESNEETWEKLLAINFKSVLYTAKAVLPQMISHGSGKIVNISSDAGRVGSSWEAVYAGAKGAVIAFSKTIAREVARYKINVNVVCPGLTETPLLQAVRGQSEQTARIIDAVTKATPFRRPAQPEEIAAAVLFLASPAAEFITGQTLSVSGGVNDGLEQKAVFVLVIRVRERARATSTRGVGGTRWDTKLKQSTSCTTSPRRSLSTVGTRRKKVSSFAAWKRRLAACRNTTASKRCSQRWTKPASKKFS